MNKIAFTPALREIPRVSARQQIQAQPPADRFEPSQPEAGLIPPNRNQTKVSLFHRATGAVAGALVGSAVALVVVGGPAAVAIGAVAGLAAGALAAGTRHSTSEHTSKLHQLSAAVTGLIGGSMAGLQVGDMLYHAQASFASSAHVGGALIGAAAGALALGIASRFFPDKQS